MIMITYILLAVALLLLNAFFVLAEFSLVKARTTQIDVLAVQGNRRAKRIQYFQNHLDGVLSVCQVGITLASIGLGFVGEPAFAELLKPAVKALGASHATDVAAHGIAISLAYVLVSFLHILMGELIPKSVALRETVRSALYVAYPMVIFHYLFIVPIWLLNSTVNLVLRLFRMPPVGRTADHTEDEIRIILGKSQARGVISFRRLLYIENILDLGTLTARNAMTPRSEIRSLSLGMSATDTDSLIAQVRYSRYPVLGEDADKPLGFVHVKDLYFASRDGKSTADLRPLIRPCLTVRELEPLEQVLSEMQRKGNHMAMVLDSDERWTGLITMEDAIEEVVGAIEEEFPVAPVIHLRDVLVPGRVLLDVPGDSILSATRHALALLPPDDLPTSVDNVVLHVAEREGIASTYVGRNLAIPHARLDGLIKAIVVIARLRRPIPAPTKGESIRLLFILLTPSGTPRVHQILISRIAGIFGSEFIDERLCEATTPGELYNAICTAEQTALA